MSRYYFSVMNHRPFNDVDGLELPSLAAVRTEAIGFANDVMRISSRRQDWSRWIVRVTDDDEALVLDLPFVDAQHT
jgi:hypothetical protein